MRRSLDVQEEIRDLVAPMKFRCGDALFADQGIADEPPVAIPADDGNEMADRAEPDPQDARKFGSIRKAVELEFSVCAQSSDGSGKIPGFSAAGSGPGLIGKDGLAGLHVAHATKDGGGTGGATGGFGGLEAGAILPSIPKRAAVEWSQDWFGKGREKNADGAGIAGQDQRTFEKPAPRHGGDLGDGEKDFRSFQRAKFIEPLHLREAVQVMGAEEECGNTHE